MRFFGRTFTAVIVLMLLGAGSAPVRAAPSDVGACIRISSGGRAWLQKTLWGLYDQERGWPGAEIGNRNGTVDLGPLQVNSLWVPILASKLRHGPEDVRRWLRDDTCFNVGVAAWIFISGFRQTSDYWTAVGTYHSRTRSRADAYARGVASRLRRRYGNGVFSIRSVGK